MIFPGIPDALQRKLDSLPDGPGCNIWKDAAGEGAVRRQGAHAAEPGAQLLSQRSCREPKNQLLMRSIADVETIVVGSETQSLLLENNLIKEYQPRFNVSLKDDKSYPSIAVTLKDPFPRVLGHPPARLCREPATSVHTPMSGEMRRTLALVRRIFTVRSCHRRHSAGAPRASLSRLPHRALPGAVRRLAGGGGLPRHDRRGGGVSRRAAPSDVRTRLREMMQDASGREGLRACQGSPGFAALA
jgi:hypothetical protein